MREIKFKAKVADEPNEWVIGYLCSKDTIYQEKEHEGSKCCGTGTFKVKEETIGQYTGLKDKNGVEIYEGDIIGYFNGEEEPEVEGIVKYGRFNCSCCSGVYGWYIETGDIRIAEDSEDVIVLGNIYENPELLEVENE